MQVQDQLREFIQGSHVDIPHALPGRKLRENVDEELVQQRLVALVVMEELKLAIEELSFNDFLWHLLSWKSWSFP